MGIIRRVLVWRYNTKRKQEREKQLKERMIKYERAAAKNIHERPARGGIELENGERIELVWVEGGSFMMGSEEDEKPVHRVTVNSFWMGIYPVTQAQWRTIMGYNPSYFNGLLFVEGAQRPVEQVSWDDCRAFFEKLNAYAADRGVRFRLPTEAEWEYAARGGSKSKGYRYAGSDDIDEVAWYDANSGYKTHPVGKKKPNELGLYDMSGNVREWCEDDWHGDYHGAPIDGSAWVESPRGSDRVSRGGSWNRYARICRSAYRSNFSPSRRFDYFGIRVLAVWQ